MSFLLKRLLSPIRQWPIRALWRSLLLFIQAAPTTLLVVVLLNMLFGAGPMVMLWLSKITIDEVTHLHNKSENAQIWQFLLSHRVLFFAILGFIILVIVLDAAEDISSFCFATLSDRMEGAIKERIYRTVSVFDDITLFETPELLTIKQLAEQNITNVRLLVNVLTNNITGVSVAIPVLVLSFAIAWWVPLLIFLSATPLIYAQMRYQNRIWSVEQSQANLARQMRLCEQVLTGEAYAKELRLFHLQSFFLNRWRALFERGFQGMQQTRMHGTMAILFCSVFSGLGAAIPYVYVIASTLSGRYTLGDLALYTGLVFQARRSLQVLLGNSMNLHKVALGAEALFRLLDLRPTLQNGTTTPSSENHESTGITLQNLSFSYPGSPSPVLYDINLHLQPDEIVVIVGENGAGKTTLVKLLCRLYDPTGGTITWNGEDIRSLDLASLRERIAVVLQDYAHFPTSLRENIGLGSLPQLNNEAAICAAAKTAGLTSLIESLPNGLDTPLSKQLEQGIDLSGGQWQRIAIARALLRQSQAQLLLLDEPTAALDPKIEHEIFDLLLSMAQGKMTVIVSHRLALARMAHRIIVLEHGTIVEMGSHAELIARRGHYHQLFTRQASHYIDQPAQNTMRSHP